tara:strand:+ start:163 stop:459 length:297 start_codon:yes stop_codon:yes gene_type:complete
MSKTSDLSVALKNIQTEMFFLRAKATEVRASLKAARANAKVEKTIARQAKTNIATVKKAERIAKLEAKLLALKTGPVGIKARKANKKPSKVIVTKIAA